MDRGFSLIVDRLSLFVNFVFRPTKNDQRKTLFNHHLHFLTYTICTHNLCDIGTGSELS